MFFVKERIHKKDKSMNVILRSDIDWAYGILLALREYEVRQKLPNSLAMQVEGFIDHYHRIYS